VFQVVREVGVNDVPVAPKHQHSHLDHRLLGIAPGAVRILFRWKVGFEGLAPASLLSCRLDHAGLKCPVA
jgi:hypothetical protein